MTSIDKKIRIETEDDISAVASDIANIMKIELQLRLPLLLSSPPSPRGMLNAAVNTSVAMSVETIIHDFAMPFIQHSALVSNSVCSSVNSSRGVFPLEFLFSMKQGGMTFLTTCNIEPT